MNDPSLASERASIVRKAKREGIPKEDASRVIQHEWTNMKFEGHHLKSTIDRIYDDA